MGFGGGKGILFFVCSNVFPSSSQNVPEVTHLFPKTFPITLHFYPILFGHGSTPMYIYN